MRSGPSARFAPLPQARPVAASLSSLAPRRDSRVPYSLLADPAGDSRLWRLRLDSRGGRPGRRVRARLQQDVGDQQQRHEKRTDCAEIGKEGQGLRSLLTGSRKPRSNACACGGSRARQAATAADRRGSIRTPGASSSIGDYPENAREKPAAPNRRSPNLCHGPVRPYRRRRDLYGSTSLLRIA
jgi:hypothetical protein